MNIILFGAPGSGKGTQCSYLIKNMNYKQISTGDLLRAAIAEKTDLGLKAKEYMDKGNLVPDDLMIGLISTVLKNNVGSFVLDGFPRTTVQAEALDRYLNQNNIKIGKALFLDVLDEDIISRLSGRLTCPKCGATYHAVTLKPKVAGKCDKCGSELTQRKDDTVEVIKQRLDVYKKNTEPLKGYFKEKGMFVEINGNKDAEHVFAEIQKIIQ